MCTMSTTFSLGNAILKTADSPVHAPETFRDALLHKYLDAASRTAVAQTCTTGLSWMLQEWPKGATLRVPVRATSGEHAPDVLRHLQRTRNQLDQRRSSSATALVLQQQGWIAETDTEWWRAHLGPFTSCAAPSTLTLWLQRVPAALLEYAGAAWPTLTSLSVGQLRGTDAALVLPPTSALPALRTLTLGWVAAKQHEGLLRTVGPYLPQLHSLTVEKQPAAGSVYFMSELFSHSTVSWALTTLSIPFALNAWLARRLQLYYPALQMLRVAYLSTSLRPAEVEAVASVCSWHTLACTKPYRLPRQALVWLPAPADTKLTLAVAEPGGGLEIELPVTQAASRKLQRIQLTGNERVTFMCAAVAPDAEPAAFRAALPYIQHLQSPNFDIILNGVTVSNALVTEMNEAAAAGWCVSLQSSKWPEEADAPTPLTDPDAHGLATLTEPLTDALLARVVQRTAALRWSFLYVPGTALVQGLDEGMGGAPWARVIVEGPVDMPEWLPQSELLRARTWGLKDVTVCLTAEQVQSGQCADLVAHLSRLSVKRIDTLTVRAHEGLSQDVQPAALRASLSLVQALGCAPKELCFSGWSATSDVIREFKALSDIRVLAQAEAGTVKLGLQLVTCGKAPKSTDEWPIVELPRILPRCFKTWRITPDGLKTKELKAFIKSAPTDRTVTTPLKIKVLGKGDEWATTLNTHLLKKGTCPYVHAEVK